MNESIRDAARAFTGGALAASLSPTARLFALGEPTHGVEVFLELRNELFRHLVEHQGCRSITLESDCLSGLAVDAYVTGGAGTLDDVMSHGFSHGFGASTANRELVRWMRAYNERRPSRERLRFYGFDGPLEITGAAAPRPALTALHDYLAAHLDPPWSRETLAPSSTPAASPPPSTAGRRSASRPTTPACRSIRPPSTKRTPSSSSGRSERPLLRLPRRKGTPEPAGGAVHDDQSP